MLIQVNQDGPKSETIFTLSQCPDQNSEASAPALSHIAKSEVCLTSSPEQLAMPHNIPLSCLLLPETVAAVQGSLRAYLAACFLSRPKVAAHSSASLFCTDMALSSALWNSVSSCCFRAVCSNMNACTSQHYQLVPSPALSTDWVPLTDPGKRPPKPALIPCAPPSLTPTLLLKLLFGGRLEALATRTPPTYVS